MAYAVVSFTRTDDVEEEDCTTSEIPMAWLFENNTKCWWPSHSKNVGSLISRNVSPNIQKWSIEHDIVVEAVGVSLEKARKLAKDNNYVSSDDANKGRGKRQIINPSKFSSDEDVSGPVSSKNWRQLTNISLPPALPMASTTYTESPDSPRVAEEAVGVENDIQSMPVVIIGEQNLTNDEEIEFEAELVNVGDRVTEHAVNRVNREPNTTDIEEILKSIVKEQHQQITRMFVSINIALKSIDKRLKTLEMGREVNTNDGLEAMKQFLPLGNTDENSFENVISSNPEIANQFTKFVTAVGGNSAKDNVSRVLKKIFTNKCAMDCSWMGRKNNFAVNKLLCMGTIK
ncbi:hypothetical protein PPYR_11405, partial [Photinus pyralis]